MDFTESIRDDIINNLQDDNNSTYKQTRDTLTGLECPACGETEAYAYLDKPEFIRCNRGNNCNTTTHAKTIYPELWQQFNDRYPSTEKNPKATAIAYLQSRYLNPDLFEFEQGEFQVKGKTYPTVKFTQDGVVQHRLIDYTGKDKSRNTAYIGKVYETKSVATSDKIFIVEGVFNALSLEQCGHAAIATYTSGSIPEEWFIANKEKTFVIAFDNDNAGRKGALKLRKLFDDNQINYQIAMTPCGTDWNDLLIADNLNDTAIEKAYWQGRLEFSESALNWFEIYRERYPNCFLKVLEFNLSTSIGRATQGKTDIVLNVKHIADCTFKLLHSTVDDSDNNRQRMTHVIEVDSHREGKARFDLDANEITRIDSFKSAVANLRQIFSGTSDDLNHLASHLFNQKPKPPKLRALSVVGYDDKSKWFVYPTFAYDTKGKRIEVNAHGFFDKVAVRPFNNFSDPVTTKIDAVEPVELIKLIYGAYGNKGLLAFGYYVSATFSHDIFKHFNFYPFLSSYGSPHAGKSGLSLLLNRVTFTDSEGHAMSKTNTAKGELRKIGQGSSIVRALLEGRQDATRFDYDSILPLYNRNSLYTRATTSQDNRTHDLPLKAAITFVWNHECFTLKAAKERVISIPFLDKDITEETSEAWEQLQRFSPEQLAGVGHLILSNRNYFEQVLVQTIIEHSKTLKSNGIKVTRIADNYAIAMAGITTFLELIGVIEEFNESLTRYTTKIAAMKLETAKTENPIVDLFLETLKSENLATQIGDKTFCFHLPRVLEELAKKGHSYPDKTKLVTGLKTHDDYVGIKSVRVYDQTNKLYPQRCWVFRNNYDASGFIE